MTQLELKNILHYNEITGIFTRIKTVKGHMAGKTVGTLDSRGYLQYSPRTNTGRKRYRLHRLAWLYMYGYFPEAIDHINRIKTDNRISNLREVDQSTNTKNKTMYKNNTSGTTGVRWHKTKKEWRVFLSIDKREKQIGTFKKMEDAIACRRDALLLSDYNEGHGT